MLCLALCPRHLKRNLSEKQWWVSSLSLSSPPSVCACGFGGGTQPSKSVLNLIFIIENIKLSSLYIPHERSLSGKSRSNLVPWTFLYQSSWVCFRTLLCHPQTKMTMRNHQDTDNFSRIIIVVFLRFKIAQLFYFSCRFQVMLNRHVKCSQWHYIPITCYSVYEDMICLWNDCLFLGVGTGLPLWFYSLPFATQDYKMFLVYVWHDLLLSCNGWMVLFP